MIKVVNWSMTSMMIDERIIRRSIISVNLIIAGMSLKKGHTVMRRAWRTADRDGG